MKITIEQAQYLIGDDQAILRGYLTQEVIDFAYKIVKEIEEKKETSHCGNPHQYWLDNFQSYQKMSESFPEGGKGTRKYAKCCELVDKIILMNKGMSLEEAAKTI